MAQRIDLDDNGVFCMELTVAAARAMDEDSMGDVLTAIDEAQGPVFTGEMEETYLVIKIVKGD